MEAQSSYQAANANNTKPLSTKETLVLIKNALLWITVTLALSLQSLFEWIFITVKPKDLSGKVVLITGGGNGLGREIARALAKEKCVLAIVDVDSAAAKKIAGELSAQFGMKAIGYYGDVSDYKAMEVLKATINRDLGIVNILVNNAAILSFLSVLEKEWTEVEKVVKVNLLAHFWTIRLFLDDMITSKDGHIVAISSIAALMSVPHGVLYAVTKHGIHGLMTSFNEELNLVGHSDFIKTTTVYPYCINTSSVIDDNLTIRVPNMTPEYVANVIVDGLRRNRETVIIPKICVLLRCIWILPVTARQYLIKQIYKNVIHVKKPRHSD